MATHSLLDALSGGGDLDDDDHDTYKPTTMIRITRHSGRKSSSGSTATPELQDITSKRKRSSRKDSTSPAHLKRQKLTHQRPDVPAASPTATHRETRASSQQTIRPAITSADIITNSANDKSITDTMARMQRYLDDDGVFTGIGFAERRNIVKGLKSSFGNRYKGRCTEVEMEKFIALWVQLADAHNGRLSSDEEWKSVGIKVDPKLRR